MNSWNAAIYVATDYQYRNAIANMEVKQHKTGFVGVQYYDQAHHTNSGIQQGDLHLGGLVTMTPGNVPDSLSHSTQYYAGLWTPVRVSGENFASYPIPEDPVFGAVYHPNPALPTGFQGMVNVRTDTSAASY